MRKNVLMQSAVIGAIAVLGLTSVGARAAVVNSGFETGSLAPWAAAPTPGSGGGQFASVIDNDLDQTARSYPTFTVTPLPAPADGKDYLQLAGYTATQDVGGLAPDTTYTLTVAIGSSPFGGAPADGSIALLNGIDSTETSLASITVGSLGTIAANTFADLTLTYTTGSVVSGDLTIAIISPDGFYSGETVLNADNVRLDASAVPEPASLGAIVVGGAGLLTRCRRRV